MTDREKLEIQIQRHGANNHVPVSPEVFSFKRARVTSAGLIYRGFKLWEGSLFRTIGRNRKKQISRYGIYKRLTEPLYKQSGKGLVVHHVWSSGYHHWLMECCMKLILFEDKSIPLYLPEDYPSFAFESARLIGYDDIRIIPKGHSLGLNELITVSNPDTGYFVKEDLWKMRTTFLKQVEIENADNVRIYISRDKAKLRRIVNENRLIPILKEQGFQILANEELSLAEQIKLFSQADVLVANHGAGMSNMLFMKDNSKIIELYRDISPHQEFMNICYYRLAEKLGFEYNVHFIKPRLLPGVELDRTDCEVDVSAFTDSYMEFITSKTGNF